VARILGKVVKPEEGKFAALAGAFSQNGILLYVPKNVQVNSPYTASCGGRARLPTSRTLLVLVDEGASVTFVHESASPTETGANTMHAGMVEIKVEQGANLKFVELQSWGKHVWNFSHERARVERDANLDWIFGAIGSRLTKNFTELDLAGQGSTGRMSGFYFTDGNQHLDHDTQQNHFAPNTTSDLLFKGALKGKSRSVWQGMIYVAPGAQKTDGYQANRNLVLDDQARADSIPGLEILADDVRCTHGATVGKLEEEPLFYLEIARYSRKKRGAAGRGRLFRPDHAAHPLRGREGTFPGCNSSEDEWRITCLPSPNDRQVPDQMIRHAKVCKVRR
jgi:Fe-S cluster assembly protein SufD